MAHPNYPLAVALGRDGALRTCSGNRVHTYCVTKNLFSVQIWGSAEAGFQDGPLEDAKFSLPSGIAITDDGVVFVSDTGNHCVRMIEGGIVTTVAGDGKPGFVDNIAADEARLNTPRGLCLTDNNDLLIVDSGNNCIRKLCNGNGRLVTIAGQPRVGGFRDGAALGGALFNKPFAIAANYSTGAFYISDCENHRIRKLERGAITTVAGCGQEGFQDGLANTASFRFPCGIATRSDESVIVADSHNNAIRQLKDGIMSTYPVQTDLLRLPTDVCAGADGLIFVADYNNSCIRSFQVWPDQNFALGVSA